MDQPQDQCPTFLQQDEEWVQAQKKVVEVVEVVVVNLVDVVAGVGLPPDTMPVILLLTISTM